MLRFLPGLAACLIVAAPVASAQSPPDLIQSAKYAAGFQNPDGGFAPARGGASTLGATSSATRVLKYTGGAVPDVLGAIKFVKSCVDKGTGGFAPTPGGKADVGTTASGLMALAELKIADDPTVDAAVKFLEANAKTFEEVRIAAAGFEAVKKTSPVFDRWAKEITDTENPDGTFGSGDGKARETGGKAVALLRLGKTLDKKAAIFDYLRSAQKPDGGWSRDGGPSELDSTYRIMRGFFMAGEKPDLDRLTALIARCRQSDGSYGAKPAAEGSPGGTYLATILLRWARLLSGEPPLVETAGFQPLFNGKDLTGWEGDTSVWSARDGTIVGSSTGLKNNVFLATEKDFRDFVFKATFRLANGEGNSGIQFRSVRVPGHEMSGYQADVGQGFWGCLYDESRRNKVLVPPKDAAAKAVNKAGWNQYTIRTMSDDVDLTLNGVSSVSYKEVDSAIARDGKFGLQVHEGGPTEVRFKDVYIQPLPSPKADDTASPGFHLKTLKGERKYVVYLPQGYDGRASFPVVLFLHGSGERGEDGVKQAQVGLGPAILNNPEAFKAIAVIPQARQTWAAGSDDAKAALDALDEVLGAYKADRSRVVLTGLSMGGRGAWENAAANPDRFAAVAPVCGQGKTESAATLAKLPVWAFVGDADRDQTVLNARSMVAAIREAGGKANYTEYRGVGHNSWDRAYNDPDLIRWLLSQSRH